MKTNKGTDFDTIPMIVVKYILNKENNDIYLITIKHTTEDKKNKKLIIKNNN